MTELFGPSTRTVVLSVGRGVSETLLEIQERWKVDMEKVH